MAVLVYFDCFSRDLAKGVHNLHTHTLKVYLTDTAPDVAADRIKAELAEIAAGNGYTAGGIDVGNSVSMVGNNAVVGHGGDAVWTAAGGSIGPGRYAVLYNDDATSENGVDPLICYWDRGSSATAAAGDTITVDFGTELFILNPP